MKTVTETTTIEHPLESVFDISPNSTVVTTERLQLDNPDTPSELYDKFDHTVDGMFQEVYEAAMTSFADQAGLLMQSDPKFSARNMEVANAFLSTALNAAKERAALKIGKEKLVIGSGVKTVNNNLIMDRNELLKMLKEQK